MKLFITILLCGTISVSFSQTSVERLSDKAFKFYIHKEHYDSALFYYKQIIKQFPDYSSAYITNQIGDCYLELGDTKNAEKYYLQSLSYDRKPDEYESGNSQTRSCFALSDIYYGRGEYRKALTYLGYTKNKYKPLRWMCGGTHGGYERKLKFAYKKSLCYYGINKDSAIIELAPYIFRPASDVYLDSSEYEAITKFFVNTVFEVYGKEKAKLELIKAINKVDYSIKYDESYKDLIRMRVYCFIIYAKTKFDLNTYGWNQVDKKGDISEYDSKESYLKEFTDSPAYNYIMAGEFNLTTMLFTHGN